MANLAIKGHSTRGNEVIELLEMLGGRNDGYSGLGFQFYYYIDEYSNIIGTTKLSNSKKFIIYTLEKFLEEFPYKVGDKVIAYAEGCIGQFTIQDMRWNYELNKVEYKICSSWCDTSLIQPYKEETMDRKYNVEEYLKVWKETERGLEVMVNDNFELKEDNGKFYIIKKQSQYPKTLEECCKIINTLPHTRNGVSGYTSGKLWALQKLLICRDAYWKIAGEQMGLEKLWNPDTCQIVYSIARYSNEIVRHNDMYGGFFILEFPTKEMRDAFYENFEELIEKCKKLL